MLALLLLTAIPGSQPSAPTPPLEAGETKLLQQLDLDRDGIVRPQEAADAIERLTAHQNRPGLKLAKLDRLMKRLDREEREELLDWSESLDRDGDGRVQLDEIDDEFGPLAGTLDADGDGVLSMDELAAINDFSIDVFIHMEVETDFAAFDAGDVLSIDSVAEEDEEFAEMLNEADANKDGAVTREELLAFYVAYDPPLSFDIDGTTAVVTGTIDISTPSRVMELILHHPEVDTLILLDCPGSIDDDSSMLACQLIRHHGLTTITGLAVNVFE